AYSWQVLTAKAKFIAQVMSCDLGLRSIEDVELATLSYAEVKALASGNPRVIEKAGVDADVARLASLFSVWRDQRYRNESEVARLPGVIEGMERRLTALKEDAELAMRMPSTMEVEVHGRRYRGNEAVGEVLRSIVRTTRATAYRAETEEIAGGCGGFKLGV